MKKIFILLLFTGCVPCRIPVETCAHPACPEAETYEVQLSSILKQ